MLSGRDGVMTKVERIEFNHMTFEKILDKIISRMKKGRTKNLQVKIRDKFTKDILLGRGFLKQGKIELKFPIN